jgi:hypothetical protein
MMTRQPGAQIGIPIRIARLAYAVDRHILDHHMRRQRDRACPIH